MLKQMAPRDVCAESAAQPELTHSVRMRQPFQTPPAAVPAHFDLELLTRIEVERPAREIVYATGYFVRMGCG
jgi:hypothetical protein